MNWFKKEITSAFVTLGLFFTAIAIWTGEYISLIKTLGLASLVFGSIWFVWRGTYKLLDKLFPEKNNVTTSVGAINSTTVNFSYDK